MNNYKNKSGWMSVGGVKTHAISRIIISALVFSAYYGTQALGWLASNTGAWPEYFAMAVFAYAATAYYWAWSTKKPSRAALSLTAALDISIITVASVMLGPIGPALFPLYLMVVFAYGIPNGEFHLQLTAGLSSLAFSTVYVLNPWWNDPVLAAGLLLSLFFLPLMMASRLPQTSNSHAPFSESDSGQTSTEALTELSQELHSQISEVITSSEGLLKQRDMSPRKKRLTRTIADSSASALRLVKEVDEYARLSSGQHEYDERKTSLVRILSKVNHQVTDEADKKRLNYEVIFQPSMLAEVSVCPTEVRRVLEHLVFNAIKYTEEGFVRVTVTEKAIKNSNYWRFEVSDSGSGIDQPEQESVFEPFVRTHAGRVHETRGIGLGTTIARQLVEGMGGSIGMQSEVNSGSTFWFEVPVKLIEGQGTVTDHIGTLSCLSLSTKEKGLLDKMEVEAVSSNTYIAADDFPHASSETADSLVVGEHVPNQQFIQILDTVSMGNDVPPVVRFQRLQPDDMVIYSRQKGGEIYFLPTSLKAPQLAALLSQLNSQTAEVSEEPESVKEKLSVLIADGSNVSRDILATMLVNRGHQIYMARSPIQALDILSGIKLDLLLLDPALADDKVLTGLDHKQEQGQSLKVLLLGDRTNQLPARLEPYLYGEIPKPFKSSEVYERIETLFGLSSAGQQANEKADKVMRDLLFSQDPQLIDRSILDELEKVDTGNVLVQRFIQRYIERSEELIQISHAAFSDQEAHEIKDALYELEKASDQIGLKQLANLCKRIQTMQEADLFSRSESLLTELADLYEKSVDGLQTYNQKANPQ